MRLVAKPDGATEIDATETMYPSRLAVVRVERTIGSSTSTTYGYVLDGDATIGTEGLEARAEAGAFMALTGVVRIRARGTVVVIERLGFRGVPTLGRIEERGRLAYIDGCSDTLLVSPPRLGDPALNHLHFPPGVVQSVHRHPSIRLGVVARGSGFAFGPGVGGRAWEHVLECGAVFLLEAHEAHAFRTADASMDVIAYHPDSDWGPTDAAHPMLNRTYVAR